MKQARLFLLFFFILALGFMVTYYSLKIKSAKDIVSQKQQMIALQEKQAKEVKDLETQVSQLNEMLNAAQRAQQALKDALETEKQKMAGLGQKISKADSLNRHLAKRASKVKEEREKTLVLEKELNSSIVRNETFAKELADFKKKIELIRSIKEKLLKITNDLSASGISESREIELKMQLESLTVELGSLNNNFAQIFGESLPLSTPEQARPRQLSGFAPLPDVDKDQLSLSRDSYEKLRSELNELQGGTAALKRDYASLYDDYKNVQEQLKKSKTELDSRSEKILLLQAKLAEAENKLIAAVAVSQDKDNESVLIRENYASLQKEQKDTREMLKKNQTESNSQVEKILVLQEKLAEAENKLVLFQSRTQDLERQSDGIKEQYQALQKDYNNALGELKKNQNELNIRAEKILALQEKLAQTEDGLIKAQAALEEMEKESALIREQYVSLQLERQALITELNQTRGKLTELKNKLGQIGNLFGSEDNSRQLFPAQEPGTGGSKKVDVELLMENQTQGKR